MTTSAVQSSHVQNLCDLFNPTEVNASTVTVATLMTLISVLTLGLVPAAGFSINGLRDHCAPEPLMPNPHTPETPTPPSLLGRVMAEARAKHDEVTTLMTNVAQEHGSCNGIVGLYRSRSN